MWPRSPAAPPQRCGRDPQPPARDAVPAAGLARGPPRRAQRGTRRGWPPQPASTGRHLAPSPSERGRGEGLRHLMLDGLTSRVVLLLLFEAQRGASTLGRTQFDLHSEARRLGVDAADNSSWASSSSSSRSTSDLQGGKGRRRRRNVRAAQGRKVEWREPPSTLLRHPQPSAPSLRRLHSPPGPALPPPSFSWGREEGNPGPRVEHRRCRCSGTQAHRSRSLRQQGPGSVAASSIAQRSGRPNSASLILGR